MNILGLGIVSSAGTTKSLRTKIENSEVLPYLTEASAIDISGLNDFDVNPRHLRKMSHFAKFSLYSTYIALEDSKSNVLKEKTRVAVIQASTYGPIVAGIELLDDLIDSGDANISPLLFSSSVFNTSATYLTLFFGIQGPTFAITCGKAALYNSFLLAEKWIQNNKADYVIVGIGDEYHEVIKNTQANEKKYTPVSEGWTTFILGKEKGKYPKVQIHKELEIKKEDELAVCTDAELFKNMEKTSHPLYIRGSYPTASSFDLALTLLAAEKGAFCENDNAKKEINALSISKEKKINFYETDTQGEGLNRYEIILNK